MSEPSKVELARWKAWIGCIFHPDHTVGQQSKHTYRTHDGVEYEVIIRPASTDAREGERSKG